MSSPRRRIDVRQYLEPIINITNIIIGGGINFLARFNPGITLRTALEAILSRPRAGAAIIPPISLDLVTDEASGAAIVETTVALDLSRYHSGNVNDPASDWENIEEAEDAPDSSDATISEGLLLVAGTFTGHFDDPTGKDFMTIDSVTLELSWEIAEFLLVGSTFSIDYRVGDLGTPVSLVSETGLITIANSQDHTPPNPPDTHDITLLGPDGLGAAWTWQNLRDLQIRYTSTILVDVGNTQARVDAGRLVVAASHTETA